MGALIKCLAFLTLCNLAATQYYLNANLVRNCPSGYRWYDYHCYEHQSSSNYPTLEQWCKNDGAQMPIFDYRSEWYFLEHWHGNQIYKLGMKWDTEAGRHRLVDGKLASESYTRWASNEPNNGASYSEAHASSYYVYDDHPNHHRHTWCEKRANHHDAQTLCASQAEIRSRSEPIFSSQVSDPQSSFEVCAENCLGQNYAYSAVIDSTCLCMTDMPNNDTCVDMPASEHIYYEYTTDTVEQDFDMVLEQPDNMRCVDSKHTYYNGHCYEMVTVGKHYFAHDDEAKLLYGPEAHIVAISDAAEMRFLDEVLMGDNTQVNLESVDFYVGIIDDRNVCDDGWTPYDGACFHFRGDEMADHATQQAYCQNLRSGADLIWFEDSNERHYALDRIMPADHASTQYQIWTGLYDIAEGAKTWRYPMWHGNSGYQSWYTGEGSGGGEHCTIARSTTSDYALIDYPCSNTALAVCKYNRRERDNGGFRGYVTSENVPLEQSYHRWVPNHGVGPNTPYCAYHYRANKFIYQCNCQDSRYAVYEYPAKPSNFTQVDGKVEMFTPIEARLTHDVGDLSENSVDFGYDGMFDWDKPFKTFSHMTRDVGVSEVSWDSRDFYYQRVNGSDTYETYLPMAGSAVFCPPIVDTTNEMECDVGATGEDPTGVIDFGYGVTEDVVLQDSAIKMYGPDIAKQSYTSHNPDGQAIVMYNTRFTDHGFIQSFEWNCVLKGEFKFVVWRARCSEEQVFCSRSMSCHDIVYGDDVCKTVNNVHKVNCGGNKWSLSARSCVDGSGNKIAPTRRYHGAYPIAQFDNVGEYYTVTSRKGRHSIKLEPEEYIEVRPGDFLGYIGMSGRYADNHMGAAWTAYSSRGDNTWWPQAGVGHWSYEFHLNAYVSTMNMHAVAHTYPVAQVGPKMVTFTASDSYVDDTMSSTNNSVFKLIEGVEIVDGAAVIKETPSLFEVNDHIGYPVYYDWDFADGTDVVRETTGRLNHSFANSGRYNVTVRASNLLSEDIAWTSVLIQARINTGTYWQYDNSTELGQRSVFKVCIDDGNEVTYSITVGDGSVHSGVQVFEENPSTCGSGWYDRNTLKCYQKSPGTSAFDAAREGCAAIYDRAFPAYYDSVSEYSNAWGIYATGNLYWGYHRQNGVWYDTFKRELDAVPHAGGVWYDANHGPGTANDYDCVLLHETSSRWTSNDCAGNQHTMCMYEGRCETFSIDIDTIGTYEIVLKAENAVSEVEDSYTQYVQRPIEGLEIHAVGPQQWGDTVELEVTWTSGSMIIAKCYNSDSASGTECGDFSFDEPDDGLAGSGRIRIPLTEYEIINDHARTVRFVNKISEMEASQSFTVMYAIEGLNIDSTHDCAITAEDTITYTLTADQMSHTSVHISFNDQTTSGSDHNIDIAEMTADGGYPSHANTAKYDHVFDHIYPEEGTYTLLVNISNAISQASITRDIVIENPIRGYRVEATGPIPIWPGDVATVDFKLVFDPSHEQNTDPNNQPHLIPTDVTQSYVYGHPDCSGVEDINECASSNGGCGQICMNTNGSYYCACEFNYHLDTDGHACLYGNGTDVDVNATTTTTLSTTTGQHTTPDMWNYLGQVCPEASHTDMVHVTDSVTDDDSFDYEHYGTFEVTMSYANCISDTSFTFTVDIDEPSMNLTIISDEYILPWTTNSTLTTTMSWGSRINLTYNFNDTNPDYEIGYDRFYPNTAGHQWDKEGTFYPTVTAVNLVGAWTAVTGPVYVQYILADALRVETNSIWTIPYDNGYRCEVYFNVYLIEDYADMMPTNVTANATFGDLIPGSLDIATLNNQYLPNKAQFASELDKNGDVHVWTFSHNYTVGDTYTLQIDFQNWVSTLTVDVEFHAVEEVSPITGFVKFTELADLPYGQFEASWYEDDYLHEFVDCKRVIELTNKPCMFGLRELAGLYVNENSTSDRRRRDAESQNATALYNPIPTDLVFKPAFTASQFQKWVDLDLYDQLHNGALNKEDMEEIRANQVNLRSDLPDSYRDAFDKFIDDCFFTNPPLKLIAALDINKTLSSQGLEDIIYFDMLDDWMVRRMYSHNETSIISIVRDGIKLPEDLIHSFPLEEPLTVYLDFERGTHLHYRFEWGDNYTEIHTQPFATHRYAIPGVYDVKVIAFNVISNRTFEQTVNIQRSIDDLLIWGPEQATRNVTNYWHFDLGTIGTDSCYMLDFKDVGNDRFPIDNQYYFIGHSPACQTYFEIEMAKFPRRLTAKTNEQLEEELIELGMVEITQSFTFGTLGTFKVTMTGKNRVSSETVLVPIAVTKGPCFKPLVLLADNNPCEPNCQDGELAVYRANPVELSAVVQYNCTTTTKADHQWAIVRVNEDGSEEPVIIPGLTLFSNYSIQPLRTMKIDERVLPYGKYKFSLNVTMYDEEIWQIDYIYVHIIKSPLVLNLQSAPVSTAFQRWKFETNFTINAIDFSRDPDDELDDRTTFSFVWTCRRQCETSPEYNDDFTSEITPMTTQCDALNMTYFELEDGSKDGGCFVEDGYLGAGLFTTSTEGEVTVDLSYAYALDYVVFDVYMMKDTRVSHQTLELNITEGMPPQIDPDVCISNCLEKVNYNAIYSMEARVKGKGLFNYAWTLYQSPVNDFTSDLVEEVEYSEWNRNLPSDGSKQSMCETGNRAQSLAFEPGFFTLQDTSYFFFVAVKAWRATNVENYGMVVVPFQVNEPPLKGNCTAYPLAGNATETRHNVNCTEFWDQHLPIKYQMGYRVKGESLIRFTPFRPTATDPTGGIVLPPGKSTYNNEIEVFVRAKDGIGGLTLSEPMIIQSFPIKVDTASFDPESISGGDPQQVAQLVTSFSGCVGVDLSDVELSEEQIAAMSEEEQAEYYARVEEQKRQQEEKAAAFKEVLADIISNMKLESTTDVDAAMGASAAISDDPRQTSPAAADKIMNSMKESADIANKTSGSASADQMSETCGGMVNVAVNMQKGAGEHSRSEAADPGLRRRKREAGLNTADKLLTNTLMMMESISGLVGSKKVYGEGDTVLDTPNMRMNVMKQYASAFDDPKLASGGDGVNGIALPPGDVLLGTGNGSAGAVASTTNNYNTLPFMPHAHEGEEASNETDSGPSGNFMSISMLDDSGAPLNNSNNESTPVSHIFLGRDEVPEPVIVQNIAVKQEDTMLAHKIMLPKQSSIHIKIRRTWPVVNETTGFNHTDNMTTTMPTTTTAAAGRRRRSVTTADPFLAGLNSTYNASFYDDLQLVFVLYFKKDYKPTAESHDFNCTLPIIYYDLNENTTVAMGGAMSTISCEDIWAMDENATCETHTLNRDVYPLDKQVTDYDDMSCYVPDTWIDAYDKDQKMYVGVQHFWVNATNMTSVGNATYDMFTQGWMPEMIAVDVPAEEDEIIFYEMEVSASQCLYWSPFYEDYITDGCEVGPLTQPNLTHCVCQLLAPPIPEDDGTLEPEEFERKTEMSRSQPGITFGSGLSIPMNTIDLSNSAFNNLGENPLVFSVLVSLMCAYMCLCIWASAADRKDAIKAGVSPLLDNDPRDRYLYEVTVYTGNRTGSSTTAKVSMVFSGEEDETPPRLIFDDKRDVLQKGGVDGFVMATPRSLGQMSHVRVWHDNSGSSPGWFFSRMQVVDMQTLDKYYFILDRWLNAAEDDGIIDRIVPLAGKDELTGFSHLFFTKARKDLMDGHIWFSVYGKPPKSNFTRVQRLTCCISLLLATMVGNILLYQDATEEYTGTTVRLGPITLTIEQILKGVISSLIAFPINLVIVLIFKNAKEPPYDLGKRCCAPCKKSKKRRRGGDNRFAADELAHQAKILDGGAAGSESRAQSFASLNGMDDENEAVEEYITEEAKKRNKKFKLPWGFVFVAYFLCFACVAVGFWYVVEQAGAFGKEKAERWLAAFAFGIVESIFMSQPIKVVGLALFFALVIKKPDQDEDVDPGLEKGEEYLHKHEKQSMKLSSKSRKKLNKYKSIPLPPTEEYLSAARALKQKEMKMMELIWELFLYVIFLYLLMMVSYGNRDPITHRLYSSLYQEFHDAAYVPNDGVAFTDVTGYSSFWAYCNQTLLPSLWSEEWYDGVVRDEGFTSDRNSFRVGVPRLRQLRMPSERCDMPMYKITKECNEGYNIFYEDTGEYYPGWIPATNTSAADYDGPYPGWFWQSSGELDGFPFSGMLATYGGGGFNKELGHTREMAQSTIDELSASEWLTPETRAVIIEFVIYNSNVNLFAVSSMTFEFLPTGTILPVYKMALIRFDRYIGSFMITVMVAELLTMVYTVWFIYKEVKVFKADRKKYFKVSTSWTVFNSYYNQILVMPWAKSLALSFWNCIEFITLLLLVCAIIMFFARFALTRSTSKEFSANPESFVSFQFATTWDEIYGYLLSFIIFFANVKFLKLLRFNKKMSSLGMTMSYIGKPLLSFSVAWGIAFIAFAQMAYLVYARLLQNFSTFLAASNTLFTLMLNKFNYKELEDANYIFAPIIFLSFTFGVTFTLINFMVTIILEGFAEVTEELRQKENQYEIVDFIVGKFKGAAGISTPSNLPSMNREPDNMVSESHAELIDRFEDFEEMFRDFCTDENRGEENLIKKYEREILLAKKKANIKTIYTA